MIAFQFFYPIFCGFNIQFYKSNTLFRHILHPKRHQNYHASLSSELYGKSLVISGILYKFGGGGATDLIRYCNKSLAWIIVKYN